MVFTSWVPLFPATLKVSDYEQKLIEKAIGELKGNIQEGVDFVQKK